MLNEDYREMLQALAGEKASATLPSSLRKWAAGQGKPCGFCMT